MSDLEEYGFKRLICAWCQTLICYTGEEVIGEAYHIGCGRKAYDKKKVLS